MTCDDFKRIFPKYQGTRYVSDKAEVEETKENAKVRKVVLENSCCQVIDPLMVKELSSFFEKAGSDNLFLKDCDGIFLYDGSQGKKHLIFCELKSEFSTPKIYEGYKQILSSCIKLKMLMNLLPNYRKDDYEVLGFIFSRPKKDLRDWYKQSLLSSKNREASFVRRLCYTKESAYKLTTKECFEIKDLKLGENVLFDTLELHHIAVDAPNDTYRLDVEQYIS